jgi:hypothetical protein
MLKLYYWNSKIDFFLIFNDKKNIFLIVIGFILRGVFEDINL